MKSSSSLVLGALVLSLGVDAHADNRVRMDDAERLRFRNELLRQDIAAGRPAKVLRAEVPGAARPGRLSPEERRALREQLRQNPIPLDGRGARRAH
jgi:hypothetical protein